MKYISAKFLFIFTLFFLLPGNLGSFGKTNNEYMLVSTSWLAEHINDPSIIILYVGMKDEYDENHILGAYLLPVMDIFQPPGKLNHEMPSIEKLKEVFKPFGIKGSSRIVLYYSEDWLTVATRVYVTLDYIGLGAQTSILDGGLTQWLNEDRALTTSIPEASMSDIVLQLNENALVNVDWVQENLRNPGVIIIDGRPEEFYDGTEKEDRIAKFGHITGAISIPFVEMTLEEAPYRFKNKTELENLFTESGVKPGSTIVAYCNTGVWATLVYFTAKYLGYESHFYDGSFEEWSMDDALPVTEPVKIDN